MLVIVTIEEKENTTYYYQKTATPISKWFWILKNREAELCIAGQKIKKSVGKKTSKIKHTLGITKANKLLINPVFPFLQRTLGHKNYIYKEGKSYINLSWCQNVF